MSTGMGVLRGKNAVFVMVFFVMVNEGSRIISQIYQLILSTKRLGTRHLGRCCSEEA